MYSLQAMIAMLGGNFLPMRRYNTVIKNLDKGLVLEKESAYERKMHTAAVHGIGRADGT